MSRQSGPGPIPDRWLPCPRKSFHLIDNKFLAFKTPLGPQFDPQVPEQYRFPIDFIFCSMKSYKVKVGLWIDLTFTDRFYDKSVVEKLGCKYVKLQCRGHGETPTEDQTRAFINVCDKFIKTNPLDIIGVHCTHGFNRSGFLIVAYLVEKLDWGVDAAVAEFAKARPPGIYKQLYLNELFQRYEGEMAPTAPELPEWCLDYDDSVGDDPTDGDSNKRKAEDANEGSSGKRKRKEFVKKNPTFMEGVSDVEVVREPELSIIQKKVQKLAGWKGNGFPGSQPVSMDVANIRLLAEKPYRVSWKADGTRYLMYIRDKGQVFCVDRDNCVFQVKHLKFPYRKNLNVHLKETLLDGEMVIDKVNGKDVPRFLVYDIISLNEGAIRTQAFYPIRIQAIQIDIIQPRHEAMRLGIIDKAKESFSVRLKDFYDVSDAAKLLGDKFCKALSHEPDGLIFQPSRDPYVAGRCMDVLKWKPASLNSVDFKLKITMEEGCGLLRRRKGMLFVGGMEVPFDFIDPCSKAVAEYDGKIIECKYENNKWVFMRERTDKSFPNSYDTAVAVCNSIKNPVTKEFLLDYIEERRFLDLMPPPGAPPRHRIS